MPRTSDETNKRLLELCKSINKMPTKNGFLQNQNMDLDGIASPGLAFALKERKIVQHIQTSLCSANAYCQSGFVQVVDPNSDGIIRFGECIYIGNDSLPRPSAVSKCASMGAVLVSEFDATKQDTVKKTVYPTVSFYWIGLQYNGTAYVWDQNNTPLLPGDFTNWEMHPPSDQNTYPGVYESGSLGLWLTSTLETAWPYVCQRNTCDTDIYC